MTRIRTHLTVSLDGYTAGPNQSLEQPLGEGGLELHAWAFATRSFRALHGLEGGVGGLDDERAAAAHDGLAATIMGRNMFGPVRGDWPDESWRGWWGERPPFGHPVFVLTHYPRAPLELEGGTSFHFVSGGLDEAVERALEVAAASGGDIAVAGGAQTVQQALAAGVVDDLELHVVPLLLGSGSRLFERLDGGPYGFTCVELASSPGVAHFRYARSGPAAG